MRKKRRGKQILIKKKKIQVKKTKKIKQIIMMSKTIKKTMLTMSKIKRTICMNISQRKRNKELSIPYKQSFRLKIACRDFENRTSLYFQKISKSNLNSLKLKLLQSMRSVKFS